MRYSATTSPLASTATSVFAKRSGSADVATSPATMATPYSRASERMRETNEPSRPCALRTSSGPRSGRKKLAYSGTTTSLAPRPAATATFSRRSRSFSARSAPGAYCATATASGGRFFAPSTVPAVASRGAGASIGMTRAYGGRGGDGNSSPRCHSRRTGFSLSGRTVTSTFILRAVRSQSRGVAQCLLTPCS